MTVSVDDPLFRSAPAMAHAVNYTAWTFSLFASLVRGNVLEVGCGVGTFTRHLLSAPGLTRLLSIDVSAAAVAHCQETMRHPALELRHADVAEVSGAFDLIVCMNVLEHIEDDQRALRHMLALLRPGGSLFLLVPAHDVLFSEFDKASGHFRRYTKRRMKALLARTLGEGMRVPRMFYFNTIGALGYLAVYRLLCKAPRADASQEIGWFDRVVVPLQRRVERSGAPFGISLVTQVVAPEAR